MTWLWISAIVLLLGAELDAEMEHQTAVDTTIGNPMELCPTRTRYSASAISYNLAYTIFGGTAPLLGTWLVMKSGSKLAPAIYYVCRLCCSALGGDPTA